MATETQERFFAYARERHRVYLARERGDPPPWTYDPILRQYRFTCVFRELDRTTLWFRDNVREKLRAEPECLLATVFFRWFNRITTGEVLFNQLQFPLESVATTAWQQFKLFGDTSHARSALLASYPDGPWVTGSYMIRSPNDMTKLDGILHLCAEFWKMTVHGVGWRQTAQHMLDHPGEVTMEGFTRWLQQTPGQGPFLAYEVACDLQHTDLLCRAPDIMTWANVGPGALRGLNRIHGRINPNPRKPSHKYRTNLSEAQALDEMRELLSMSRIEGNWLQAWGVWDMRTVEHNLCESDKHNRVRLGEGTPRQLFRNGCLA